MTDSVAIYKLGMVGSAYDMPGTCRAYTYIHQPNNGPAWRLGLAASSASRMSAGDYIDRGLVLLKCLQDAGFGVYELDEGKSNEI